MRTKKFADFRPSSARPQSLTAREALKQRKLQAEIENIKLRIEVEREKLGNERSARARHSIEWKVWVPILLSAFTVLTTAATVGTQLDQYLTQRVKEYDVKLSEQMIGIAQKLADPNASQLQSSTDAVLLSAFEQDALPLLFAHLRASTATSQEPILHALELIQRKKKVKPGTVTQELLAEARRVFDKYGTDVQGTANYVTALGRLASDDQQGAVQLLLDLRQRVRRDEGTAAGVLKPMIEKACRQITGRDCPQET